MRFSSIDWNHYDLKPLAKKTTLSEEELFGVLDSEVGMHIVKGASTKPKNELSLNAARMIYRLMEGAIEDDFNDDDLDDDEDEMPIDPAKLPATLAEVRALVDALMGKLPITWASLSK